MSEEKKEVIWKTFIKLNLLRCKSLHGLGQQEKRIKLHHLLRAITRK